MSAPTRTAASAASAYGLLALANLFWAGNWITGRALRGAFEPLALNFWRWLIAALVLAPFALPVLAGKWRVIRQHAAILLLLALTGVAVFQSLLYLGLRSTPALNAMLLNSSMPMFMLLCSWAIEGERATRRQIAGMLVSLAGILVILSRGEPDKLLQLGMHGGDAWILLAMPVWGVYSVLLKRRPKELHGIGFLFVISVAGLLLLLPFVAIEAWYAPPKMPSPAAATGAVYIALAASVGAFICWNRGVAVVGANAAGFTNHLIPAFGTVLAIVFLDERLQLFHLAGIATILAGVVLATRASR